MELLLEHDADPNIQDNEGLTALMYACKHSSVEAVELLLKYGADPNIKDNKGYNICDQFFQEHPQILEKYGKNNEMCNKQEMVSKITEFLNSL